MPELLVYTVMELSITTLALTNFCPEELYMVMANEPSETTFVLDVVGAAGVVAAGEVDVVVGVTTGVVVLAAEDGFGVAVPPELEPDPDPDVEPAPVAAGGGGVLRV